jgi:hypothetical protein
MFVHPDLMLTQFHERERDLIAAADRHRLLTAARRLRRDRRTRPGPRGRPDLG